jgi:type IV pilus assembly protein PilW
MKTMDINMSIKNQLGLTITELMVAMAVGLIVSAAVAGLFLQTSSSNSQNSEIGYLQDNGRYALKVIADDLEMANFWAGLSASNANTIQVDNTAVALNGATVTLAVGDNAAHAIDQLADGCSPATDNWNYAFANPLNYIPDVPDTATARAVFPCIPAAPGVDAHTDVLMIKRTKGLEQTANQVNGRPYIRGNRNVATVHKFVTGATDAPPAGYFDWEYKLHIYYISGSKLMRQALKEDADTANDPSFDTEELADGIERFHVQFGIDNNSDGVADFFTSAPTAAQLRDAMLAKIYVLARGSKEMTGYTNDKAYQLGDLPVAAANDGYYRRVFSTTVIMKNTQAVLAM